jgi:ubiquinol-cytochrome c reductase cytochrome b subunit
MTEHPTGHASERPTDEQPSQPPTEPAIEPSTELERVVGWMNSRLGLAPTMRVALRKVFPDHWAFLLGEVALFCFVILLATGTFLTFFYVPDANPVTYSGAFTPLTGSEVSAAYASTLHLSFEVRAGLLMRQTHHWTALVFIGAIAIHMARVFFTGAFRRPRELNWVIGVGLSLLALAEGFTGYSLPDDLLSGTGLRITYSALLSIPFAGPWAASLLFGGEFPSPDVVPRFFVLHILLLPALLAGGVGAHVLLTWIQKHTQFRGGRAREDNVVGLPFWPAQAFRSLGLFFLTAAVVVLLGGLVQINPVWVYGPFVPAAASSPAQPDWYVGWLEGALRLGLPIEPTILGVTIPSPFVPGIVLPGLFVTLVLLWPFIEARIRRDSAPHHLLDRWWDVPFRAASGAAFITLFLLATFAGGNDVLSVFLNVPIETLTLALQVAAIVLPTAAWLLVYRIAWARKRRGEPKIEPESGVALRRRADGGFEEVPEP